MSHELHTFVTTLLSPTSDVRLAKVTVEQETVRLQLTATAPRARGPHGTVPSSSGHRRDQRHLTDRPWGTCPVHIQLTVRTCVCQHPSGERRIFTERLPACVAAYARNTRRLVTALRAIGMALGGQAGARLAARLRLPTSPATLLRLVQAAPLPQTPALQAVGVDEWAWRRGHRDGTILVNLADHHVVDLLPDRSAASVAAWLGQHPTLTTVCRDRRDLDADGMRRGAPEAVQGVDRFHLVQNLRQALEAFLSHHRPALQAAAIWTAMALIPADGLVPVIPMDRGRRQSPQPEPQPAERPPRHARWVTMYETFHRLSAQGTPIATMARQLGISRPTVYADLRRDTPPGPRRLQRRPSARVLTPYIPSLIRRWRESGADSRQLWREIRAHGYTHAARTVCRFITRLRRAADVGQPPESQSSPYTRPQGPPARAVSLMMVCQAAKRASDAQTYLDQHGQVDTSVARADALSQAFLALVRERRGEDLEAWMSKATHSGIAALARFARGLQDDLIAMQAGLTLEWSHGATEGQMHRLKLLKRQGFGRAGLALLRQRVLHAA
jgi:transposase